MVTRREKERERETLRRKFNLNGRKGKKGRKERNDGEKKRMGENRGRDYGSVKIGEG